MTEESCGGRTTDCGQIQIRLITPTHLFAPLNRNRGPTRN